MYQYKATHQETFQVINKIFSSYEEAEAFANMNKDYHSNQKITSLLGSVDGLTRNSDEDDSEEDEIGDGEGGIMGTEDEETEQGFDWTK